MFKPTNPENIYFIAGLVAAFSSSMARTIKQPSFFTVVGFFRAITDAITCTFLSSGIALGVHEYFQCSLVYTIAIGTFVGSLGTTYIIEFILKFIRGKFKLEELKNDDETKPKGD